MATMLKMQLRPVFVTGMLVQGDVSPVIIREDDLKVYLDRGWTASPTLIEVEVEVPVLTDLELALAMAPGRQEEIERDA